MKDYREMADNVLRRRDEYKKAKKKRTAKTVSVLSCFIVAAVLAAGVRYIGIFADSGTAPDKSDGIVDTSQEMKRLAKEKASAPVAAEDFSADMRTDDENTAAMPESGNHNMSEAIRSENHSDDEAETTKSEVTIDAPVAPNPGDTGALTAYDEAWGGYYMDENGNWVVWLTEDTPENRQAVFMLNPTLREDNTIFKKADYSKAYLTELMAKISAAMGNKELPFVTTAALREERNRVEVTMISDAPEDIDQVLMFDPTGGAIEIRYSDQDYAIIDLIKEPKK